MQRPCTRASVFLVTATVLGTVKAPCPAEEIWAARDGTLTLILDRGILEDRGLTIGNRGFSETTSDPVISLQRALDGLVELRFAVDDNNAIHLLSREFRAIDGWIVGGGEQEQLVAHFAVARDAARMDDSAAGPRGGAPYLEFRGIKGVLDRREDRLMLASRDVVVTPGLAAALGRPELSGLSLGRAEVSMPTFWIGGDAPARAVESPPVDATKRPAEAGAGGPDMVYCQLYGLGQYGRVADIVGLSIATTSWNIGDAPLPWHAIPSENHPFIVMDLFRLRTVNGAEHFEQIGQSWIKHGFCALDSSQCSTQCQGTGCSTLGVGCTDTYGAGLNASQGGLGPRFEVDPWNRLWDYPTSHMALPGHSHDGIEHRLQVHDADLDPAQNPGATYYTSGYYVAPEDINQMNSAAWKPVTVSGSPGGTWSFSMSGAGTMPVEGHAIDAWAGATHTVLAQQVPVVEFVSPDGRCILASKATDLGGGNYHYEYALMNIDMDRQGGSFTVPFPTGTNVTNVGFHAVEHHDEPYNTAAPDAVPIDNAPWTPTVASTDITWSTTSNPLRWGTLYNFRFDADAEPGDVTVTLGLFRPGTPSAVSGTAVGPFGPPPVCGDGVVQGGEECDPPDGVHCDASCNWICGDGVVQAGEECDPPDGTTCDANCQIIYICGDGVTDPGEDCDDAGESAACDADCTFALCGDGTLNTTAGEVCDDGGESATCDANCTLASCGDGTLNVTAAEQCDDGNTTPGDGCDANCQAESNDLCVSAIPICPGVTQTGSTAGADSDGTASCGSSSTTPDVWYSYTPGSDGTMTVETCNGGNYDTVLSVHTGCPGTSGNEILCNDDDCPGYKSRVTGAVTAGNTYLIRVSGWNGNFGDYVLDLTGPACGGGGTCGDGNTDPGEDCDDAGESATCDANCTFAVCGDGTLNVTTGETCDDGNTASGDGCDATCQTEPGVPNDNCADAIAVGDGAFPFDTTGATTDGPAHVECEDGFANQQVSQDIWYCYNAACTGDLTVSTCNSAAFDTKLAVYDGCACPPTALLGCDDDTPNCSGNTTSLTVPVVAGGEYLVRVGGYGSAQGSGTLNVSCSGVQPGDALRGGQLWDAWWIVNEAPAPTGDHPLYPPAGQQSGSTTYRCKECHGWDYKGADGAYGSGVHFTGIAGVFGTTMTPQEMFDLIKLDSVENGHGFANYGLTDDDIWDLVQFLTDQVIDTDAYIDANNLFIGDEIQGEENFDNPPPTGTTACVICHAPNGTGINFGTPENPEWVGTIAYYNPWELLHKIRFGQPGQPMPPFLVYGGTTQGAADIGVFAQRNFPIDCMMASHCADADPCMDNTCVDRFCVDSPTDCTAAGGDCVNAACDPAGADGNCDVLTPINEGGPCDAGTGTCVAGECVMTSCVTATDCGDTDQDGIVDDACLFYACVAGTCDSTPKVFGDGGGSFGACPPDGFANVHDRNHALSCFAGVSTCDPINNDLGGPFGACPPDGFCNIHDANHAMAAFSGTNTCFCPPLPAPYAAGGFGATGSVGATGGLPASVGSARVTASADRRAVRPGDLGQVRVFVDADAPLRSYQLDMVVSGGRRGHLELVKITLDPRDDALFAGRSDRFDAFNPTTGRMLAGLEQNEGVAVNGAAYLATYTYRASPDAAGSFVVEVDRAGQTYFVAPFDGRVEVAATTPAVVVVVSGESAGVAPVANR